MGKWLQVKIKTYQKKNEFKNKGISFHSKRDWFQLKRKVASTQGNSFHSKKKFFPLERKVVYIESKEK